MWVAPAGAPATVKPPGPPGLPQRCRPAASLPTDRAIQSYLLQEGFLPFPLPAGAPPRGAFQGGLSRSVIPKGPLTFSGGCPSLGTDTLPTPLMVGFGTYYVLDNETGVEEL